MNKKKLHCYEPGLTDFPSALELQKETLRRRQADETEDTLFLLQHPPTFTLGKRGNAANLLVSEKDLEEKKIPLVQTDRGGDITFHGPGQLVAYPVIKLERHYQGVRSYVSLLEKTVVETLAEFGIASKVESQFPGVWTGDEKIAALGVRIQRGVSTHGISLNVNPDLAYFEWMVPCGIRERDVTSMEKCLGTTPPMKSVAEKFVSVFSRLFKFHPIPMPEEPLR